MQVDGLRLHPAPPARVRVFSTSDLHVTLGFLGSVEESDAQPRLGPDRRLPFVSEGDGVVQAASSLSAIPESLRRSARWSTSGGEPLTEMIAEARETLLSAAGAPEDTRPPLPHMTLARIQRRANAAERRQALRWAHTIDLRAVTFTAPSVALYTWAGQSPRAPLPDRRASRLRVLNRT